MPKPIQKPSDMDRVWKDISDIWEKLNGEIEKSAAPYALTREIEAAGHFTDDIVKRIYARYEFCEGFKNEQLRRMKSLAENARGNSSETPEEVHKLQKTLTARADRDYQKSVAGQTAATPVSAGLAGVCWRSFSPSARGTWPEHKQSLVFGPHFSHPISATFEAGHWYRHGTGEIIRGITKYMHVSPPEDWS